VLLLLLLLLTASQAASPWFFRLQAVFNYEFDSLTHDDPVISAVYTALREAEYRSTAFIPYWNFPPARWLVPRQRRCQEALQVGRLW
jgi:hypothetical protein